MLGHGHREAARLHIQDWIWRTLLGCQIRPTIYEKLAAKRPPEVNIVDVGTGNCIWLLSASIANPQWSFTGLDVSSAMFPPAHEMPDNVRLDGNCDVFGQFAPDMYQKFDMVHVRAFGAIVKFGNPEPLTKNLIKLLKPGGFIQWDDIDLTSFAVHGQNPSTPIADSAFFWEKWHGMNKNMDLAYSWVPHIAQTVAKTGFEIIEDLRLPDLPALHTAWTENLFLALESVGRTLPARDASLMGTEEEYWERYRKMAVEIEKGAHLRGNAFCVVGRKPL